ncbi:MAG: DUF2865 domain-containing protein [Hyphomicrobiaceae bacterium]|nr:DUF2865 domain-containing protein [Hyphomicrobiaceae bacterium]
MVPGIMDCMRRSDKSYAVWWAVLLAVLGLPLVAIVAASNATAQGWQWPWETDTRRDPPPRPAPQPRPEPRDDRGYGGQGYGGQGYGAPGAQPPAAGGSGSRASICLQLERQLAATANQGNNRAQRIAEIDRQLREARRNLRRAEIQIERRDCYENFLFTRTLRRNRTCVSLARTIQDTQRRISELETAYQQAQSGNQQTDQNEIIRALARNNCGEAYVREARRRSPMRNFWQDQDTTDRVRGNTFAGLPFATYRTLCVRLCDGYYFPVSFSTLPTHFTRDADACQSRCAAPTELYFHRNPGGSIAEMVSQKSQEPYKSLRTAFRYRKEYVQGCSCKQAEYVPQTGAPVRKSETPAPVAPGKPKRSAMSPIR